MTPPLIQQSIAPPSISETAPVMLRLKGILQRAFGNTIHVARHNTNSDKQEGQASQRGRGNLDWGAWLQMPLCDDHESQDAEGGYEIIMFGAAEDTQPMREVLLCKLPGNATRGGLVTETGCTRLGVRPYTAEGGGGKTKKRIPLCNVPTDVQPPWSRNRPP